MEQNPYQVVRSNYPTYSRTFRIIADFILQQPEDLLGGNIHQMALQLHVAESSIVRFSKMLGFSGFRELKLMLAKYSSQQPSTIFENFNNDDPEVITRSIFALSIETLQTAVEQLNFQAISDAAALINQSTHIIICGVGSSASIADNFAVHLMRIGMPAVSITDSELLQVAARLSTPDTLLIALSKSGRSTPLVQAFGLAKEQGAKTVCMTGYEQTPLGAHCDVNIVHYCPSAVLKSTRIVQHTIIDCICINATLHRQEEVKSILDENRRVIETLRL